MSKIIDIILKRIYPGSGHPGINNEIIAVPDYFTDMILDEIIIIMLVSYFGQG